MPQLTIRGICYTYTYGRKVGSGALSGKILLEKVVENNKIDANFRTG